MTAARRSGHMRSSPRASPAHRPRQPQRQLARWLRHRSGHRARSRSGPRRPRSRTPSSSGLCPATPGRSYDAARPADPEPGRMVRRGRGRHRRRERNLRGPGSRNPEAEPDLGRGGARRGGGDARLGVGPSLGRPRLARRQRGRALALAPGEVLLRDVQVSYRSGRLLSMTSLKWRPGDGPEIPLQASRPRSWLRHHQHVERLGGTRARGLAEAAGCAGVRGVPCGAAICRLARAKWRGLPSAEE